MAKQTGNKTATPKRRLTVGERKQFVVNVFHDELEGLGIADGATLLEAQTIARARMGVAVPMRNRAAGTLGQIRKAVSDASEEQRARILKILAE